MTYELHVTVDPPHSAEQRETFERLAALMGWHTSEIARDPLLGKPTRFYFTTHEKVEEAARCELARLVGALRSHDVPVLREKIEFIVHDVRHG